MLKHYTFQKERIFSFTDAVFSIAITLLVLEISIPTFSSLKERGIELTFQYLYPEFIGFFISFMVIALYWKFYLIYSRYIQNFDNKMFTINTLMLLSVALLPFSTGFFVQGFDYVGPFTFYCGNLVFLGLTMLTQLIIVLKRAKLQIAKYDASYLLFRGWLAVLFWAILMVLSFFISPYDKFLIPLIFVFQQLGKWYFNHKSKSHS